jgi:ABC-type branched-subunit amino acid transport system substrate-binding protein
MRDSLPSGFLTTDQVESIITENFQSEDRQLFLLGSGTMYKQSFVVKNRHKRDDTEGMLIPLTWHRSVLNECDKQQFESELECKASRIFLDPEEAKKNKPLKPLAISWRTATAYESTKAILEGLKIAKENSDYCGGLWNSLNFKSQRSCMRQKLKDVLRSDEFNQLNGTGVSGARVGTFINFEENGERSVSNGLGVVVEARDGNFWEFPIEDSN